MQIPVDHVGGTTFGWESRSLIGLGPWLMCEVALMVVTYVELEMFVISRIPYTL